jgi:hypothetical protein
MGNNSTQLRRNKSASQEEAKSLTPLAQSIGSSRRGKSPTQLDAKDTCSPSKDACSPLSVDSYGMIAMLPLMAHALNMTTKLQLLLKICYEIHRDA